MARAAFNDTIASVAGDGTLKAISNVKVEVTPAEGGSPVTLWNHRTATAPANELGTSIVTGPSGLVSFYVEGGEYNVTYTDLSGQNRIASPQTFGWDAVPGSQNPEALGFDMGDIKISSKNTDHGRWLRLDGRELTQAEVAGALSLSTDEVAAFVGYMGTGSSSKYGAAASSKIKLPDARRRAWIGAGPSAESNPPAGTTARGLGASGGVESVTLTKAQSGLPGHGHSVTDPGHGHANNLDVSSAGAHQHSASGLSITAVGDHTHKIMANQVTNTSTGGSGLRLNDLLDLRGTVFSDGDSGWTDEDGAHTHGITGSVASAGAHAHGLTGGVTANSTGISVVNHSGADASSSHENMPPFVAVGYLFIRV